MECRVKSEGGNKKLGAGGGEKKKRGQRVLKDNKKRSIRHCNET